MFFLSLSLSSYQRILLLFRNFIFFIYFFSSRMSNEKGVAGNAPGSIEWNWYPLSRA